MGRWARGFKSSWMLLHVLLPLVPVGLGMVVRLCATAAVGVGLDTFCPTELAIAMALVCAFAALSLREREEVLSNADSKREASKAATGSMIFALVLVALFVACEITRVLQIAFSSGRFESRSSAELAVHMFRGFALTTLFFAAFSAIYLAGLQRQFKKLRRR